MSDIPVGSPPAPPGRHAAPSGWYADPVDSARERYWDGWQWSRNTRPGAGPSQVSGPAAGSSSAPGASGQGGYGQGAYGTQNPPSPYGQNAQDAYGQNAYQPYGQYGYGDRPSGQPSLPAGVKTTADGVPLAGWGWRALASVIDGIIVGLLTLIPTAPVYIRLMQQMMDYASSQPPGTIPDFTTVNNLISQQDQTTIVIAQLCVALVYHVGFVRWKAATPGKLVTRLRVVPVDKGRSTERISWTTAIVRAGLWVFPGVISILFVFRIIDALLPLWHPKRQAVHDLAARTQVVRRP